MKMTLACGIAAFCAAASATPSADNYSAVTNDWQQGAYSNVYEWAQQRLAANPDDLPAAYAMVEYDVSFSDFAAMSNSIIRLMRVSDAATHPAFTNLYSITRPGWEYYLSDFLPKQLESDRLVEQQKSLPPGRPMTSSIFLEIFWNNGLWQTE